MSWLYSQALVEAYSAANCSDGEPSAPSSGSPTQLAYLSPDKMTDFFRLSRFGMTFRPLTDDRGADVLTWFLGGFPARTLALQEKAQESTGSAAECGDTWRASLAKFDPDTCSWKTAQPSLIGGLEESSVIWPRSGMTVAGQCWALPMLGRRIKGTDSGLWPIPVSSDTGGRTTKYAQGGTPLSMAVKFWPTPTAHNAKEGAYPSEHTRNTPTLAAQAGGSLNPTWVEWLMGWPLGWTDLKPLETDKFHCARQQPGVC
jgi:hypothetical protein